MLADQKHEIQDIFIKTNWVKLAFSMAYESLKDLPRRTASHKVLRDKKFNIAKNPRFDGYRYGTALMVYKSVDKKYASIADKSVSSCGAVKSEIMLNRELAEEFHKPIIIDNIMGNIYAQKCIFQKITGLKYHLQPIQYKHVSLFINLMG